MPSSALELRHLPDHQARDLARESSAALARLLREHPEEDRAHVRMDGADLILPRHALELLKNLLAEMAQGNAVTLLPVHAELTTQEAANLLNVSRPHLIKLLESGELPFTKVGTHRRISLETVLAYKQRRIADAERALQALVDDAQANDLGY
jgi:excisionase family DNA binding protein